MVFTGLRGRSPHAAERRFVRQPQMLLRTSRLILRDFEPTDVASLAAYHSDPQYLEHYETPPDTGQIVADAQAWARELPRRNYQLVTCLPPHRSAIGSVGLRQQGWPEGEGEVGFELNPVHWGRGYGREALLGLLEHGSRQLLVLRFWAVTSQSNTRAHRVLEALRFQKIGSAAGAVRFMFEPAAV
jgi:ribosomal-protein-alanine N-acetyltransferase